MRQLNYHAVSYLVGQSLRMKELYSEKDIRNKERPNNRMEDNATLSHFVRLLVSQLVTTYSFKFQGKAKENAEQRFSRL